ncbi:MAG TPA: glutaminyl-peptide cyclotransferase [Ferruginibacter sp.]|nr:glutaminyl-peptide cyclotransferase [Ferruginibacter sp.]HMP21413.1 glutaminyl-peptide cyclotransferase [Ferruginibacter sp.]
MKKLFPLFFLLVLLSCNNNDDTRDNDTGETNTGGTGLPAPAMLHATITAEYPHDTDAFTEGLQWYNGKLYESTGLETKTMIKEVDLKTGIASKKQHITDPEIFGEGINIFNGKLYQLTYQNHLVYVYDVKDWSKPVQTFTWHSEGWGMTNNGSELIVSDGQAQGNLYFVNPENFKINRIVQVRDNIGVVDRINELEYIDGYVYANIWGETYIVKIDPSNGHVTGKLETKDLLRSFYAGFPLRNNLDNVLNGIAYDSTNKKIFITGKLWPKVFELQLN